MIKLALPITVGQLAIVGMSVTDIIIAGRLSTDDLAAVTLGSTVFNLSIMLVIGIILGNGPIIGQLFSAGKTDAIRRQFQNCLWLCLPLGLLCSLFISAGILLLPRLDTPSQITGIAVSYLLPMIGSAFLLPYIMTFRTTFESMGQARTAMIFNLMGFLLNIPLDYALVMGKWGLPALGGAGCGWATLCVSLCIVGGETLYARSASTLHAYQLLNSRQAFDGERIKETLRIGLPIGGAILAEGGFFLLIPLLVAHLGAVTVSGHSVAISFDWMMFMVPMGISQAISILVAHELGRHRAHQAQIICTTGLKLTATIALCQGAFVLLFREQIAALFTPDIAVQKLAASLLVYAAIFRVFDAINIGGNGALRGYKDTRITLVLAFVGYWLIGFPLSYSLALSNLWGAPLGVEGFWVGMVIALIITASLTTTRVYFTARNAVLKSRLA
ncbi:MAG: MATE family efflux transporter [Candidatus Reddybacter sp.]